MLILASLNAKADICDSHKETEFEILNKLGEFTDYAVGYAGEMPDHVIAFGCLMRENNNEELLLDLLSRANTPGQLYAMIGLREINSQIFNRESIKFKNDDRLIENIEGCFAGDYKVSEIFSKISKGQYETSYIPIIWEWQPN